MNSIKQVLSRIGLLEPARRAHSGARRAASLALHPVREAVTRLPDPWFLITHGEPLASPYREHLAELRKDGITRVSGQISPQTLAELQQSLERFVARLDAGARSSASYQGDVTVTDEYADPQNRLYASNEPFTFARALIEICLKPELTSLINSYLRKQAYITQGVAIRLEPSPNTGYGSFQWHHNAWGKRINMMIILTEVREGD